MKKPKYCCILNRVSSPDQGKNYSNETQNEYANKRVEEHGFVVLHRWSFQETASKYEERKLFSQIIVTINQFFADNPNESLLLIAADSSRLGRERVGQATVLSLVEHGNLWLLFSYTGRFLHKYSTTDEFLMEDFQQTISRHFIRELRSKTIKGMKTKLDKGHLPGNARIGYKHENKIVVPDPERFPLMRMCFERFLEGDMSITQIADYALDIGLVSKRGNKVSRSQWAKNLRHPIYYGDFIWNDEVHKGSHEPLVTKEEWDRIQTILDGRLKTSHVKKLKTKHRFAYGHGLIECPHCGCSMIGVIKKGKYVYYSCNDSAKVKCPNARYWTKEEDIDGQFNDAVSELVIPDWLGAALAQFVHANLAEADDSPKKKIALYKRKRTQAQNDRKKLIDLLSSGVIENDMYKIKDAEYKRTITTMDREIARMGAYSVENGLKSLELLQGFATAYPGWPKPKKRAFLEAATWNLRLDRRELTVKWVKPVDMLRVMGKAINGQSDEIQGNLTALSNMGWKTGQLWNYLPALLADLQKVDRIAA